MIKLLQGDCLERMKEIPDNSIDLVLTDPPYGTTRAKWDLIIPLESMWSELKRIAKDRCAFVFWASQPFTSMLIMSNKKWFKYCWVWDKITGIGHLVAKKRPLAQHEDIVVFYKKAPTYNPQMTKRDKPVTNTYNRNWKHSVLVCGKEDQKRKLSGIRVYTHRYPKTIIRFPKIKHLSYQHPTAKPIPLCEYLIKTYSNEGDVVLDFTMGSGATGIAAVRLKRCFIGIELDQNYYTMARRKIAEAIRCLSESE